MFKTKVAHIVPPQFQSALEKVGNGYHMALGQKLVTDTQYRTFYQYVRSLGHFVIVDNGAAEPEDERVPFEKILDVFLEDSYDEIVMPDVLRDHNATQKLFLKWESIPVPRNQRVYIPQGETLEDWIDCFVSNYCFLFNSTLGIPKHLERFENGRRNAVGAVRERMPQITLPMHYFGVYRNPLAEVNEASELSIRGIDTGAAVAYAQGNVGVYDWLHYSLDWNGTAPMDLVENNIRLLNAGAFITERKKDASNPEG